MLSHARTPTGNHGLKPAGLLVHVEMLRGFSVALVLLYHFGVPGFAYGYLGVDIFFVISGFLMAKLYGELSTKEAVQDFFVRRAGRLLPAYFVTIIACAIAAAFLLLPHEVDQVAKQNLWSAALLPNVGFWKDASYFNYMYFRPLLNLWSLGVELQFYLLFPLLLFVARKSPRGLALITASSLAIAGVTNLVDPSSAFFLLPARLWEFLFGYYAATYKYEKTSIENQKAFSFLHLRPEVWLVVLLVPLVFLLEVVGPTYFYLAQLGIGSSRFIFIHFLCAVLFAAAILRFGGSLGDRLQWISKPLCLLGRYSYSIYLVHFPVIAFSNYQPFEGTLLGYQSLWPYLLAIALTCLFATGLYHLVEVTTRKRFSGQQLMGASAVFLILSAVSIQPLGVISRANLDGPTLLIAEALYDRGSYQCEEAPFKTDLLEASCRLSVANEDSTTKILLAGNSHADMIKPILLELFNGSGAELRYMKEYRGIDTTFNGDEVLAEAKKLDIDRIVLHATLPTDNGQVLSQFIKKAAQASIKVTYISPIPTYDSPIPKTMLQSWKINKELNRTGLDRASHLKKLEPHYGMLRALQSEIDTFQWLDPTDSLCGSACYIASPDGKPYYYDTNHLTLTGASLLLPLLREIVSD